MLYPNSLFNKDYSGTASDKGNPILYLRIITNSAANQLCFA